MNRADRIKVIIGFTLIGLDIVAIFAISYVRFGHLRLFELFENTASGSYQVVQEKEFPSSDIRDIELIWGSGDASIVPGSSDAFVVREEARPSRGGKLPQRAWIRADKGCLKVHWDEDGGTSTEAKGSASRPAGAGEDRRVTIEVPRAAQDALGHIVLNGTTGDYRVGRLTCDALKADFTSGVLDCVGTEADQASFSYTSGDVETQELAVGGLGLSLTSGDASLGGAVRDVVHIKLTTGDVETSLAHLPESLDIAFTTGDVVLNLPASAGFTARVATTSCDVTSDFAASDAGDDPAMRVYRNGDGSAAITVTSTGGDLALRRA